MKKTLLIFTLLIAGFSAYSQKDKTIADANKFINSNNKLIEILVDYGFDVKSMSDIKISQEPSDKNRFYTLQTPRFKKIVMARLAYVPYRSVKDKGAFNFYCTFKSGGIDYKAPFSVDWTRVNYGYNSLEVLDEWTKPTYYFNPTNISSKNQPKSTENYRINSGLAFLESLKSDSKNYEAQSLNKLYNIVKIVEIQSPEDQVMILSATKQSWQLCMVAELHRSNVMESDFESVRLEKLNVSFIAEFNSGKWQITQLQFRPKTVSWKHKTDMGSHTIEWKSGQKIGTLMTSDVKEVLYKYAPPADLGYGNKFAKIRQQSFMDRVQEFDNGKLMTDEEISYYFKDLAYGKAFFKSIEKYADTTFNIEVTNVFYDFGGLYKSVVYDSKMNQFTVGIASGVKRIEAISETKKVKNKGLKAYVQPYVNKQVTRYDKQTTTFVVSWVYDGDAFMIVDCALN